MMKTGRLSSAARLMALAALAPAIIGCGTRSPESARGDTTATAAPAAREPRHGSMIRIPSGADSILAYVSRPAGKPKAFVVVVFEWWGLVDWPKSVADRLASQGYLAIVPDLYRGKTAEDPELAHELMRGLPEERAIADIRAAADFVRRTEGKERKGGVIGFCMGGGLALRAALDHGPFQATVVCYGSPVTSIERLKTLSGPVLGIYGRGDRGIGPDQTQALEDGLGAAGKLGGVHAYENAGHAFMNDQNPSAYVPDAAKDAWREIDSFLAKNLLGR